MVENRSKPISQDSSRIPLQFIKDPADPAQRKTSIMGTIGTSCQEADQLGKMIDAGMNVARLDFSQGDHKSNGQLVANLQAGLKQRPDKVVAVVLETKGPEIRTGVLKDGKDTPVFTEQGH